MDESAVLEYRGEKTLSIQILPVEAGAGRIIQIRSSSPRIFNVETETVVTNSKGRASVRVMENLPGGGELFASLDGTELKASSQIRTCRKIIN